MAPNQDIQNIADVIGRAVPAEQIYLFGSHAYGQPHANSDYDFFLVIPDGAMHPLDAMQQAQRALARRKRTVPIDILAATKSTFVRNRLLRNTVERQVDQKGVLLYERHDVGAPLA